MLWRVRRCCGESGVVGSQEVLWGVKQGCIKPGHGECHAHATLDLACNFRARYVFLNYLGQMFVVLY